MSNTTARRLQDIRFDLAALVGLTVAMFVPFFRATVVPISDSALFFQCFHYFYSSAFFGHGLPRWIPYGAYGYNINVEQLSFLSPANYFVGLVGIVFRIEDVLLLFKLSVLLEYVTMLLGLYLLATVLFQHRATRLLVCIAATGSSIWYAQLSLNFRIYYLLPFVAYLMARFLRERRAIWLAGAGLVGIAWLLGNRTYYMPLWALCFVVISLILAKAWGQALLDLRQQIATIALSLATLGTLVWAYVFVMEHGIEGLTFTWTGRDPTSGRVELSTFLTYGGIPDARAVVRGLLTGFPTHLALGTGRDMSVYCGIPVVVFFVVALARARECWFVACSASILVLIALSLGGGVAAALYRFPGMDYYRHIGFVYGLVKILMVIASGFGLEWFWRSEPRTQVTTLLGSAVLAAGVSLEYSERLVLNRVAAYAMAIVVCTLITWAASLFGRGVLKTNWRLTGLKIGLIVGLLLDLGWFQGAVFAEMPTLTPKEQRMLPSTRVRDMPWQAERSRKPITKESRLAWALATRPENQAVYAFSYTFAHFDPCRSDLRYDVISARMRRMLDGLEADSPEWNVRVGCYGPKLRLLQTPRISSEPGDRVAVTTFSPNQLTADVNVMGSPSAWLVYAEAYHPGWKAEVNGKPARVVAVYDAMIAVWLSEGHNSVSLVFARPLNDFLCDSFAAYGVGFSVLVLFVLGRVVGSESGFTGYSVSRQHE